MFLPEDQMKGVIYLEYYAHYDSENESYQKLGDHLQNVSNMCMQKASRGECFRCIDPKRLQDTLGIIGMLHDFGKYTRAFQNYLVVGRGSKYKRHSHISACIAYNAISKAYPGDRSNKENLCINFLAYMCVRLHHGHLSLKFDMLDDVQIFRYIQKQVEMLKDNEEEIIRDFESYLGSHIGKIENLIDIECLKDDFVFNNMNRFISTRYANTRWFYMLLHMFSCLIDSDKLDSAGICNYNELDISQNAVEKYINAKPGKNSINDKRNKARIQVVEMLEGLSDDQIKDTGVYTLTAPTGIGKTLTSLDAVLHLGERLQKIYGYRPAIISAIPFINIIEQTRNDYESIFGKGNVLVNHQLQEIFDCKNEDTEDMEEALLKSQGWESPVVMTTFVQFFHSIFTGRNKLLKKFNKISGSIVILDEIQAIPEEYMPLVGAAIHMISKELGTKFILMTATKPKIIEFANRLLDEEGKMESVELLKDNEVYFDSLNRTSIVPMLKNEIDAEELVEIVFDRSDNEMSVLIVVNTIPRSIEVFENIRGDERFEGWKVLYLSTNIIPVKRAQVIKKAKESIKNGKKVILVSTQTIEAGVDLDFGCAFRDIGPLSSIIQIAGRVNREGKSAEKRVFVVRLGRDAKRIYPLHHIDWTRRFLAERGMIREKDYKSLIEDYYSKLIQGPMPDKSSRIWNEGVKKLDFEIIEEFELIKKDRDIIDVFIEYDGEASKMADEYERISRDIRQTRGKGSKEYYRLTNLLKDTVRKMSRYMISLRVGRIMENKPQRFEARNGVDAPFWFVPREDISIYYDEDTGYIFENEEALLY